MTKNYRIEVSTFWQHPKLECGFGKLREQVYDFTTNTLVADERSWFNGQDFYDLNRSPHIYADKAKADTVYDELDFTMDDWEPLHDIITEDSNERLISYRLVSVDENGDTKTEHEYDLLEIIELSERATSVEAA